VKLRLVKKRDGREVPFTKDKIAAAVARAQAAVGEDDPQAATDVADIVELALARRYLGERTLVPAGGSGGEMVPGIEEIQDLVEQALIELGHAAVAKAYILYRDRRARVRAALDARSRSVAGADSGEKAAASLARVRVQVSGGLEAWRKSRIVAALMDEADLPRATAEEIASRVEERVFGLGVRRLSTALIRELVDNELVEMGLSRALRTQRPVGIPRHDLRALVREGAREPARAPDGEVLSARDVEGRIASEILRRFALEDVLPERSAELHLSGEIHVEDLERPHQVLSSSVPCEFLLRGEPVARSAFEMLDDLADLARATSYGIVLEDAGVLFTALGRAPRGAGLPAFLSALSGVARASGRRIDVSFAAGTGAPWLARLVEEIAALDDEARLRWVPRVFLDAADVVRLCARGDGAGPRGDGFGGQATGGEGADAGLARDVEALLARGKLVPTWGTARARLVGPGLVRSLRERGALHCGGAVALNLPRAARRAGPWREDALLESLAGLVESALDALAGLREMQRDQRATSAFEIRGRTAYALVPVGLRESLRWLGDGEVRPEQGARVVAFLAEAAARFAAGRGLSVALVPWFGERAAVRFADLDAGLFQVAQPLLFESPQPDGSAARNAPYSVGFELASADHGHGSSQSDSIPAEAALVSALECGALHPPSILRPAGARTSLAALEALHRGLARGRNGLRAVHASPVASEGGAERAFEIVPARGGGERASLYGDADPAPAVGGTGLRHLRGDES
jgi:hypothetical protein